MCISARSIEDARAHRYVVTLRHDGGLINIGVVAKCPEAAAAIVCLAELAPLSAVLRVSCPVWQPSDHGVEAA